MNYHWEWVSHSQVALFEEGTAWTGQLGTRGHYVSINEVWTNTVYRASGGPVDATTDFRSFYDARRAVEALVTAAGDTVDPLWPARPVF